VRIAIDGRELGGEATGVGRYLHHLLVEWARLADAAAHRFSIYSPNGRLGLPPDFPGEVVTVPGDGGTRWEQGQLARALRKDRPDVLFAPGYTAPAAGGAGAGGGRGGFGGAGGFNRTAFLKQEGALGLLSTAPRGHGIYTIGGSRTTDPETSLPAVARQR